MHVKLPRRPAAHATCALLGVALALLVAAPAGASTIHACVRPHSGATRIVSAKAKCRHGEQKLSWSTTGPQGKTGPAGSAGPAGAPGTAGANGTGPAFGAGAAGVAISETPKLLFEKTVPPGDYVVTAPVVLRAEATTAKFVVADCFAVDKPGTSLVDADLIGSAMTESLGIGGWEDGLPEVHTNEFNGVTTMTLAGVVQSKVTSTVGVGCTDLNTPAGVTVTSPFSEMIAVQVSSVS